MAALREIFDAGEYTCTNLNGTSRAKCPKPYSCWLNYWLTKTRSTRKRCCVMDCENPCEVGAHVTIEGYGRLWHIIPVCRAHNNSVYPFVVYNVKPLRIR